MVISIGGASYMYHVNQWYNWCIDIATQTLRRGSTPALRPVSRSLDLNTHLFNW